jgi:hypothetical protein
MEKSDNTKIGIGNAKVARSALELRALHVPRQLDDGK